MSNSKIIKYIVIVAVLLIPIMYSFFYLKAYWDPYGNLTDLKVAMVNLDKGNETENQGAQFVETMVENGTFNICNVSKEDAENGLKNGEYYAMITIPETFTSDLNSASEENKIRSTITYSPNQKTNFLASQIINSAVKTIEINLQAKVAKTVTENLTDKLNEVPDSLQEIAEGTGKISDGTDELKDGANTLADGTDTLNSSYEEFDNGVDSAYEGSQKVDDGVGTLASGAETLINGVSSLENGTESLDSGILSLSDGASNLSNGAEQLSNGASSLYEGTTELSAGATSVASGATEIEGYIAQVYTGVQNLKNGYSSIDSGIDEIITSLTKLKTSINAMSSKASNLAELKTSNETALESLNSKNETIVNNYNAYFATSLGNKNLSAVTDDDINAVITQITTNYTATLGTENATSIGKTYGALLKTWRDTYVGNLKMITLIKGNQDAVNTILNLLQSDDLKALTSEETTAKLTALKTGSTQISDGLTDLETNVGKIYVGTKNLTTGASNLATGAGKVNEGAKSLNDGTSSLKTGTENLVTGTEKLKTGSSALVSGVKKLSNGGTQISTGIGTLKSGTLSLRNGLYNLSTSSKQVKTGISSLNTGSYQLLDGIITLKTGVNTFNTEVNNGLTDTKTELKKLNGLAEFTEDPIQIDEEDYGKISQYGIAFTPLFLSIGLWVGALMAYVVIYYDQDKRFSILIRHSKKPFLQIALYFGIAVLQGIITGMLLKLGLGFTITNTALYYFTCVFISVVFMSIMQFLIMNFGDIGKFLALVILVLQLAASGGTFPIQTVAKYFQKINPVLPMTYAIKLIKESVVSIDSGFAIKNIGILVLYGIIPFAITLIVQMIKNYKEKEKNA